MAGTRLVAITEDDSWAHLIYTGDDASFSHDGDYWSEMQYFDDSANEYAVAPTPSGSGWSLTRVEGQADPDVLEQRLRVVLLTHADALGQLVERIDRPDLGFSVRQSALKELLELMEEPPFSAGLVQGRLPQPGHDRGRLHNLVWHLRRNGH